MKTLKSSRLNNQLAGFSVFILSILFSSPLIVSGQAAKMSVSSFRELSNDLDARVNHPILDLNGEVTSLLKVVTTQTDLNFSGGMVGITKVEQKTGEVWVYVPSSLQRITIKHPQLGVIRDYTFPVTLKKATVYELILTADNIKVVVEPRRIKSQYVTITTQPPKADVYIDNKLVGQTPFQRKLAEGEYSYRVEKAFFHVDSGILVLGSKREDLKFNLKPKFGTVRINVGDSLADLDVIIDEKPTGLKASDEINQVISGKHSIRLTGKSYASEELTFNLDDGQFLELSPKIIPLYGVLNINSQEGVQVIINGENQASEKFSFRLMEGVYEISLVMPGHRMYQEDIVIERGQRKLIRKDLEAIYGSLDVVTEPMGASVYVDGQLIGNSPIIIDSLIIGIHTVDVVYSKNKRIQKELLITEDYTIIFDTKLKDINDTINEMNLEEIEHERKWKIESMNSKFGIYDIENEKWIVSPEFERIIRTHIDPYVFYAKKDDIWIFIDKRD